MVRLAWAVLVVLGLCGAASGDGATVRDEECGVEVTLPAADWKMSDHGTGALVCHVWSPSPSIVPRFSVIRQPAAFVPDGLATRARQVAPPGTKPVAAEEAKVAGLAAQRIVWTAQGVRAVEYGLRQGDDFVIVQVAAQESAWADEAQRPAFQAVFDSVRFFDVAPPELRVDRTTPQQVRVARAMSVRPRAFAVRRHDVRLRIDPAAHSLACRDTLEVEGLGADVSELLLQSSVVQIDSVRLGETELRTDRPDPDHVRVVLPSPLRRGERRTLEVAAHAADYFRAIDQALVSEIGVVAQVREASSYSSHGVYYPVDDENDAAVRLEIAAPEGFVAVSGGERTDAAPPEPGMASSAFAFDARPRILPAGFAVARYVTRSGVTPGGLTIETYALPGAGAEELAARQLDAALRAGRLHEERMGPLAWRRVAVCQVAPERKAMAVSLPGLVLLSEEFLAPASPRPLSSSGFATGQDLGALGVVDELGHQWNGYAAQYPNELAEGLSSFACMLHLEREAGADEYRKAVRSCADVYAGFVERAVDVAVANPAIYRSKCYRVVAFVKTPAVLDLLRQRLGDKVFFAGWRAAFESVPRDRRLDFDDFRRAFETASGQDLAGFFESWFFRPGHPRARVTWEAATSGGAPAVRVRVEQVQPGETYEVDVPVVVVTAKGTIVRMFAMRSREDTSLWPLPDVPSDVQFDPGGDVPLVRRVER